MTLFNSNGSIKGYQRISSEGGNNYDVVYSGCIPCAGSSIYTIYSANSAPRLADYPGAWGHLSSGQVEGVDDPITSGELKAAALIGSLILKIGMKSAFKHGFKYHPRIRVRGVEDGRAHNFPYSFDDIILRTQPTVQKDGSLMYKHLGYMNGTQGYFEIAINPKTQLIFHRQFNSN
ncbi:MAG: hypothetical protein U5L45_14595 [Saprospiraceae bacterium]|nr:hypothetical protein [Saprospiraceae bacterium]